MARYIDADAFKEYLRKGTEENADIIPQRLVDTVLDIMDGIMLDIDEQPTVDAVPVVRCKDCKHCEYASNRIPTEQAWVCYKLGIDVEQDWFCADGERKDDE